MKRLKDILPAIGAAAGGVCFVLLALDALWPAWSVFQSKAVQWITLIACVLVVAGSAALVDRERRKLRRRMDRQR